MTIASAAIWALSVLACAPPPAATGDAAPTADGADAADRAPPSPQVTDDATELLFSFVDAHGSSQSVGRVAEVPEAVRARVLVVDLARSPEQRQAHRYAFFADLTAKKPDGSYPVTVVSRYAGKGQAAAVAALPPPAGSVVVYSAVWCGYCKRAKAWLKEHDVPFVERDVEKTPGAQAELDAKLRAANVAGGGIPVTDWAGTLVMGFDQKRFEALRAQTTAPPAP